MDGIDTGETPLAHMRQLDGLRAVAVGMVVYSHYLPAWVAGLPLGRGGVLLFFVLSGFLITGILLRCRDETLPAWTTLRRFYARRVLRIFPLFYATLLVAVAFDIPPVRRSIVWHLAYLSNVYLVRRGEWSGTVSHFWSLAVEEQFYLVWPCCVLFVSRRALPWVVGSVIVAAPALRAAGLRLGMPDIAVRVLMPGCMDVLGLGALLALLSAPGVRPAWRARLLSPVAGLLALAVAAAVVVGTAGATRTVWLDAGLAVLAFWVVGRAADGFRGLAGRLLAARPAVALGRISYGIYVIHPLMPKLLARVGIPLVPRGRPWHAVPVALVLTAATIGLAALSWRYYEAPLNRLKRRFPYRPGPAPRLAPGAEDRVAEEACTTASS